ncbi:Ras-related RABA1f [Chlorella sorokiniana]|jgi:Ras-related protein Rab-11A|uniref:Ras-related RABA1f n=1 Tax=Chlorella sorokiniana TaxID=3076 RepID=A0A2P6TU07_CHLSO|nr:Ras-related RABA1f [Chlorella sorokiniana]|eukprot:PRW57533.1 Ras-related RABA1f [Chlorella sorokiniana]
MAGRSRSDDDYDLLMKVVLIGDSGVGKTNCLSRFCRNEFQTNSKPTIGVEFATKQLTMGNGDLVKCQIWDTAGQERYRAITNAYYRGAVGALLVYDVTRRKTFESIERWLRELREHASADMVVMLVGNKTDLETQREVSVQDGQDIAKREGLLFLETSALDGSNVEEAFTRVATEIHGIVRKRRLESQQGEDEPAPMPRGISIPITAAQEQPAAQQSRCCS